MSWLTFRRLAQAGLVALVLGLMRTLYEMIRVPVERDALIWAGLMFGGALLVSLVVYFFDRFRTSFLVSVAGVLVLIWYKFYAGLV